MEIYKTRWFSRWASAEGLSDEDLVAAVAEVASGKHDADLGGNLFKKRIALAGRGKRGGARTLIAYRAGDNAFFLYGFAKNERDNIDKKELKALKLLAKQSIAMSQTDVSNAISAGALIKINVKDGVQLSQESQDA